MKTVIGSGDPEQIRAKAIDILHDVGDGIGSPISIYCAQLCIAELQRLAAEKLERSSNNLERLTRVLIVLTIVLGLLALPPAWEIVKHWF
jgi:CHASE3 domain sensor protein